MLAITRALSDVSRTNQIRIDESLQEIADHFFLYLFSKGKGIEHFILDPNWRSEVGGNDTDKYKARDQHIKSEVKKRLDIWQDTSEPKYFVAYSGGQTHIYYLSPNKSHSGWKELFCGSESGHRQRIINLLFKVYILSHGLSFEAINGFEEVILPHTKLLQEKQDILHVWGLQAMLNFNQHKVLTLHLKKEYQTFFPKDKLRSLDGMDLGEIQVYNKKNYYYRYTTDARKKNKINFMDFRKSGEGYDTFKKTLLYYYQMMMSELESFLTECGIRYTRLDFQTQGYLDNAYIKDEHLEKVQSLESLVIINNTGDDLQEQDCQFLAGFFKHQGVTSTSFYQHGKTISRYTPVTGSDESEKTWKITKVFPWEYIRPESDHNYLVLNFEFDDDNGSMASQDDGGNWHSTSDMQNIDNADFYSQFKRRFNYLSSGAFYSMQGINLKKFTAVGVDKEQKDDTSVLVYSEGKIDEAGLQRDCGAYTNGQYLGVEDNISQYTIQQANTQEWAKFCSKYKIKVSPEFQRVMIEISIKSWMRAALINQNIGLSISGQEIPEKRFFAIYVRSPRYEESQAVAVDFLHKDGLIYIKGVIRDRSEIERKFPFLRRRKSKGEEKLADRQQIYVDADDQSRISYYTDDYYTPTLIGRHGILAELADGTLEVDRKSKDEDSSRLLPLVTYYNGEVSPVNSVGDMICIDMEKQGYIQYFVPPKIGIGREVKHGFRVYHLIGYQNFAPLTTEALLNNPLVALHFNTMTQNILKISENSQSSLLQKVARVLIEN